MVSADDVAGFVAEQLSVRLERLSPQTRLVQDLGVDGDDLVELMDAYFARFGVDPAGFQLKAYGGPEGFDLIGALNPFGKKEAPVKPLTLAMLTDAANAGRWPDA